MGRYCIYDADSSKYRILIKYIEFIHIFKYYYATLLTGMYGYEIIMKMSSVETQF